MREPSISAQSSFLLIPNDITIQIIARTPRFHHPDLSLVCKAWRSIIRSPDLYTIRTRLKCIQSFLYINIRLHDSSFKWYVLDCKQEKLKKVYAVRSIPSQAIGSTFAVLGEKIYVIGGSINDVPTNNVWVFDTRFNEWEMGVKMRVGREFAAAGVIGGKIYVLGGCLVDNWIRSMYWAEVFDPKIGSWVAIPSPVDIREKWMHGSAVIGKRMYAMADRGGVAFDPADSSWGHVSTQLDLGWRGRAAVVDDVLFCYDYLGKIRGFDVKECVWRELKGVQKDLPKFLCGATMANVGGKLCVVWEKKGARRQIVEVSCAEIEVNKDCFGELWGSVVWSQVIMEIPSGSSIVHCLAVEL